MKVKYCSAPTMRLYAVGSGKRKLSEGVRRVDGQQGDLVGLAFSMWKRWRMLEAYLDWHRVSPNLVGMI